jgi:hypothetical protein
MSIIGSIRSFFSGQTQEAFGYGERYPLSKPLTKEIRRHIAVLSGADLIGYTFERRHSDYPGAKSDIVIYDPSGKSTLDGREMNNGEVSFWEKS